jgi:hypothetical protein
MLDGDARDVKCSTRLAMMPVTPDPQLTRMVKMFWSVPVRHRVQLVTVLESMCVMLRDAGPES